MVMDKNGHSHKAAGRPDGGQYETKPGAGTDDDLEAINIRLAKTLPDLDEDTRRRLIQATLQAVDAHDRSDTGDETACWWDDPDKYEERFYDFDWDDEQAGKAIDRVRDGSLDKRILYSMGLSWACDDAAASERLAAAHDYDQEFVDVLCLTRAVDYSLLQRRSPRSGGFLAENNPYLTGGQRNALTTPVPESPSYFPHDYKQLRAMLIHPDPWYRRRVVENCWDEILSYDELSRIVRNDPDGSVRAVLDEQDSRRVTWSQH